MAQWVFAIQAWGSEFRCVCNSTPHCDPRDRDRRISRNRQASKSGSGSSKQQDTLSPGRWKARTNTQGTPQSPQVCGCMCVSAVTDVNTHTKIKRKKVYFNFLVTHFTTSLANPLTPFYQRGYKLKTSCQVQNLLRFCFPLKVSGNLHMGSSDISLFCIHASQSKP